MLGTCREEQKNIQYAQIVPQNMHPCWQNTECLPLVSQACPSERIAGTGYLTSGSHCLYSPYSGVVFQYDFEILQKCVCPFSILWKFDHGFYLYIWWYILRRAKRWATTIRAFWLYLKQRHRCLSRYLLTYFNNAWIQEPCDISFYRNWINIIFVTFLASKNWLRSMGLWTRPTMLNCAAPTMVETVWFRNSMQMFDLEIVMIASMGNGQHSA